MLEKTDFKGLEVFKRGKVRDVYDLEDSLLIVATDRISCFDVVLPDPIPEKGAVLTKVSLFWFSFLKDMIENHLISSEANDLPQVLQSESDILKDRFMIVKKCEVFPFECVVRGYISGSGWKEYKKTGSVCGITLGENLKESQKLNEPIFTPATKAESGHDENVDFAYMENILGRETAATLKNLSIKIYEKAASYAEKKGIIIADTKFEFGIHGGKIILVDEVLTPDSSRFWPKNDFEPGRSQVSFDKQFVRDYLESSGWDKNPPAPSLPEEVISKTRDKYKQVLSFLTA
ncbi:MAG: phosphoribosylaminoimidazolesuccinocarboxamide synthase [Candidatus Omnitrophica bacterium]|nr:phosphoribosylaminoimidazolesuccinocarboxamide synthase [Candidatus Omnitrophota bacterium]MBD3269798.1 phosphoribosylaminoimidazolesuccinocarboxamide synthase [Candidatus Omnitrophota bacterium]